ncbi:MAG: hypothetical protein LBV71_20315 [Prevotella sp.]|jgi:hypothetical protein|nr:hypothetical protein [Prevotella sp.]
MSNALVTEVKKLIREVDKTHRYSMSRIYGLYNEVFDKDEEPQSCASCLIRKVKELRLWLENNSGQETAEDIETSAQPKEKKAQKTKKSRTGKEQ